MLFAVGADVHKVGASHDATPVAEAAACCLEIVTPPPAALGSAPPGVQSIASTAAGQFVSASRYRVVDRMAERMLPVGRAPEQGLQVRTILASRSISAAFPEIRSIGGMRPDALRWHPDGLALDIMIPNASSTEGIALGNQIVSFVLQNAERFGLQDAIWRGSYYTPSGARAAGYGHYDHIHITTYGGGYPTGGEMYTMYTR